MKQLVESIVLPPNGLFVLIVVGVLVHLWGRRRSRDGKGARLRWLGALVAVPSFAATVLLCVPWVSYALLDSLQTEPPLPVDVETLDVGAIVVLTADVDCDPPEYGQDQPGALSLLRCRYAAHLARRTGRPLLVSGGVLRPDRRAVAHVLSDFITDELSVPVRWRETHSTDTRSNARGSTVILRREGIERIALVTHAWHMPRAKREFERLGIEVVAAPTAPATPPSKPFMGCLPRGKSLRDSCWAIHEWVGRVWYRLTE